MVRVIGFYNDRQITTITNNCHIGQSIISKLVVISGNNSGSMYTQKSVFITGLAHAKHRCC